MVALRRRPLLWATGAVATRHPYAPGPRCYPPVRAMLPLNDRLRQRTGQRSRDTAAHPCLCSPAALCLPPRAHPPGESSTLTCRTPLGSDPGCRPPRCPAPQGGRRGGGYPARPVGVLNMGSLPVAHLSSPQPLCANVTSLRPPTRRETMLRSESRAPSSSGRHDGTCWTAARNAAYCSLRRLGVADGR